MRKLAVTVVIGTAIVMGPVVSSTATALGNQGVQAISDVDTIKDGTSNMLTLAQASQGNTRGGNVRFWT